MNHCLEDVARERRIERKIEVSTSETVLTKVNEDKDDDKKTKKTVRS